MKQIIKLKNKIFLLFFFSTFSLSTFANDWKGTWNTTFGKMTVTTIQTRDITADMGDYILRGSISGNAANRTGKFSGNYMLKPGLNKPVSQVQHYRVLGSKGEFSFNLSATKQNFNGAYTTSANKDGIWKGSKVNVADISTKEPIPSYNRPNITPPSPATQDLVLWTGTWQTNKIGQLKIKWYSETHIEAKMYFKRGDYIRVADLKGGKDVTSGHNHKYFFGGPYKDSDGKEGHFFFTIDVHNDPSLNTFNGYIYIKDKRHKYGQLDNYSPYNINGITGTRTSSAVPNMNNYH